MLWGMGESRASSDRRRRLMDVAKVGAASGKLVRSDSASAEQVAALHRMRGFSAETGPAGGQVDRTLSYEAAAQWRTDMTRLQASVMASPFDAVEATLAAELGERRGEIVDIERNPFASVSFGQVHRGRLRNGSAVAIKVQHAGAADAVEADLANVDFFERAARGLGGVAVDPERSTANLTRRFRGALDCRLETQRMDQLRDLHHGNPSVVVPHVYHELSTKRVLVSASIRGKTLTQACVAPEVDRIAWAEAMWGFVHRGMLVGGLFNADPHPGNFIFLDDGRVAFIDHGRVQTIPDERRVVTVGLHRAAAQGDRQRLRACARVVIGAPGGRFEKRALDHIEKALRPLWDAPFLIDRKYVAQLADDATHLMEDLEHASIEGQAPVTLLASWLQLGFYTVLARLYVHVDYAGVERQHIHGGGHRVARAS